MESAGLLDTGPLVSFLAAELRHHAWTREMWKRLKPPLLTCEPVLTEAAFLLKREGSEADAIFELLQRDVIRVAIHVQQEQSDIRALMRRYRNRPIPWPLCFCRSCFWKDSSDDCSGNLVL